MAVVVIVVLYIISEFIVDAMVVNNIVVVVVFLPWLGFFYSMDVNSEVVFVVNLVKRV